MSHTEQDLRLSLIGLIPDDYECGNCDGFGFPALPGRATCPICGLGADPIDLDAQVQIHLEGRVMGNAIPKPTKEQAAIIGAYTGVLAGPFCDMHQYINSLLGEDIETAALASVGLSEKIKELSKPDFSNLCATED